MSKRILNTQEIVIPAGKITSVPASDSTWQKITLTYSEVPDNGGVSFEVGGNNTSMLSAPFTAGDLQSEIRNLGFVNAIVTGDYASGMVVEFVGQPGNTSMSINQNDMTNSTSSNSVGVNFATVSYAPPVIGSMVLSDMRIEGVHYPALSTDAANKQYVDDQIAATDLSDYLKKDGSVPLSGAFNANNYQIINLAPPSASPDAATKGYVDTAVGNVQTSLNQEISDRQAGDTNTLAAANDYTDNAIAAIPAVDLSPYLKADGTVSFTNSLNAGGHTIGNLSEPNLAQDAATKNYVDLADQALQSSINALGMSLNWRPNAFVATDDADLNSATDGTALSTLLPFSDDGGTQLVIGDFSAGQYLLSKGATVKLFQVYDDAGTLKVNLSTVQQLVSGDVLLVQNNLPGVSEGAAIFALSGTELVKIGDVDWSLATGISLSLSYVASAGSVLPSDTVEAAIAKLDGNLQGLNANYATTSLSNLSNTAINASLVPDNSTHTLGADGKRWSTAYIETIKYGTGEVDIAVGQGQLRLASGTPTVNWFLQRLNNSSGSLMMDWSGSAIDFQAKALQNLAAPTASTDAATKGYVDTAIAAIPSVDLTPYLNKDGSVAMNHDTYLVGRNAANNANVNMFKIAPNDIITAGGTIQPAVDNASALGSNTSTWGVVRSGRYAATPVVLTPTGDITNGQPTITNMSSTAGITTGMEFIHPLFTRGTFVNSVDSATQITVGNNATGSQTGATVTLTGIMNIRTENGVANSGSMYLRTGSSTVTSGMVRLASGDISGSGTSSGLIQIRTGNANTTNGVSGQMALTTGSAAQTGGLSGAINIVTGGVNTGTSGNVNINTGSNFGGTSGSINISTGVANSGGTRGNVVLAGRQVSSIADVQMQVSVASGYGLDLSSVGNSSRVFSPNGELVIGGAFSHLRTAASSTANTLPSILGTGNATSGFNSGDVILSPGTVDTGVRGHIVAQTYLDMTGHYISNVLDPVNNQDAATKNYVDSAIAGATPTGYVKADGSVGLTGSLLPDTDLGVNLGSDTKRYGFVTSQYVKASEVYAADALALSDGSSTFAGFRLTTSYTTSSKGSINVARLFSNPANTLLVGSNNLSANTGDVLIESGTPVDPNFNSGDIWLSTGNVSGTGVRGKVNIQAEVDMRSAYGITNMADPVNVQDAATKNYVDNVAGHWRFVQVDATYIAGLSGTSDDFAIFGLAAGEMVHKVMIKQLTQFAAPGLSEFTVDVGVNNGVLASQEFAAAVSIFPAPANSEYFVADQVGKIPKYDGTSDVVLRVNSTGANLSTFTGGQLIIGIYTTKVSTAFQNMEQTFV